MTSRTLELNVTKDRDEGSVDRGGSDGRGLIRERAPGRTRRRADGLDGDWPARKGGRATSGPGGRAAGRPTLPGTEQRGPWWGQSRAGVRAGGSVEVNSAELEVCLRPASGEVRPSEGSRVETGM